MYCLHTFRDIGTLYAESSSNAVNRSAVNSSFSISHISAADMVSVSPDSASNKSMSDSSFMKSVQWNSSYSCRKDLGWIPAVLNCRQALLCLLRQFDRMPYYWLDLVCSSQWDLFWLKSGLFWEWSAISILFFPTAELVESFFSFHQSLLYDQHLHHLYH